MMKAFLLSLRAVIGGACIIMLGCNQPAEPTPVVVRRPIVEPRPAEPNVEVGGPRGGIHIDIPRDDGRDIRVDVPPLRNPPPTAP